MISSLSISIVIPCYNASDTVGATINSGLIQTYPSLEIICVDDGSTDRTLKFLYEMQREFPSQIRVISQTNAGASAARNAGLHCAKGAYVQFLDADDVLMPKKLLRQSSLALTKGQPALIAGSYYLHQLDGKTRLFTTRAQDPWIALSQVQLGITSANLFRRDILLSIGGWDKQRQSSQEYDLMFRMLKKTPDVVFDEEPLTFVYQRADSISNSNLIANDVRRIRHVGEIREYLLRNSANDKALEAAESALFDTIRSLCNRNLSQGIDLFYTYFDDNYRARVSTGTTPNYIRLYRLLGFRGAEILRMNLKKVRSFYDSNVRKSKG